MSIVKTSRNVCDMARLPRRACETDLQCVFGTFKAQTGLSCDAQWKKLYIYIYTLILIHIIIIIIIIIISIILIYTNHVIYIVFICYNIYIYIIHVHRSTMSWIFVSTLSNRSGCLLAPPAENCCLILSWKKHSIRRMNYTLNGKL